MKVTRYSQSCMVLEDGGRKLVIDPGDGFADDYGVDELKGVEAVLYTHQHADHMVPELAMALKNQGATLYGNLESAKLLEEGDMQVVEDGETFSAAGFEITARELPHCPMPDGSAGPQNTGFEVQGIFFHPGDGKELAGLHVDNLALPIQGPDVSFRDANDFARQVQAKVVIPIHYDFMGANPEVYKTFADGFKMPFDVRVLALGEATEIS